MLLLISYGPKTFPILYGFYLECKENLNENKIDVMVKPIKPHIIKAYPCHPNLIYAFMRIIS